MHKFTVINSTVRSSLLRIFVWSSLYKSKVKVWFLGILILSPSKNKDFPLSLMTVFLAVVSQLMGKERLQSFKSTFRLKSVPSRKKNETLFFIFILG